MNYDYSVAITVKKNNLSFLCETFKAACNSVAVQDIPPLHAIFLMV